ncbi:DUF4352 domain-containing protein [Nonomuraea sp. K274]|uniref:DUF4352 domain-containing protein n=1 Tax=Nonomuraea cypriaca TaxID=1187855 RepID=A0A931A522_9ACTN|nr:DUF4352 domain-containing protein [Nonomuraea cypriaca]MBF8186346.1 DUF4352 domain-containing protein [Nonomuraea cypriaca]
MGYPSQPNGPYDQQPPQQPYGSGPQPQHPGYGYQPPTSPPPPPPRRNLGLILALAIGIPLMLLGGCAAVVLVLSDTGGRESIVTEADSPNVAAPTRAPDSSAPAAEEDRAAATEQPAQQEQSIAAVGGSITLEGMDPGLKMKVTLNQVFNPATPAEDYMKPDTGTKLVALQLTLSNVGQAVYDGAPSNGANVIDSEGQQYQSTYARIREGQGFDGAARINAGDARKGVILFAVPESAKLVKFQYGLNSGFANQKGEWTLS